MCGICGIINKDRSLVDEIALKRMTGVIGYRGPDGQATYTDGHMGFGHRRLSIIDLSDNARQPMTNENGSVVIVFNGMIYNYKELTTSLRAKGHIFKSNSDTESIVHLYEEEGADCVKLLRGMFAFAIWDNNKKELILARDRVGEKPLVYAESGNSFLFASEPKSIIASGFLKAEIDPCALPYLFSYKNVPHPRTMFEGIYKLPPASIMVVNNTGSKMFKYWKPQVNQKIDLDLEGAVTKLSFLIDESVKDRLISDVPVGAFLSGGVDSSIVAYFVNNNTTGMLKAFSVGFDGLGKGDAEFINAERVARKYNMEHHKISVDSNIIDEIRQVMWHYDEPFAIPEALVNMKFCREVRKSVKAVLVGDGADELFAGYSGYALWKILGDIDSFFLKHGIARSLSFPALSFLSKIFASSSIRMLTLTSKEKRPYLKRRVANRVENLIFSEELKRLIKGTDVGLTLEEIYAENSPAHLLDGILYTDLVYNDTHGVTVFSDVSGMSNGLEIRAPFLDHRIIEK